MRVKNDQILTFEQTIAWIISGLPWDVLHMAGTVVAELLILTLCKVLSKLVKG